MPTLSHSLSSVTGHPFFEEDAHVYLKRWLGFMEYTWGGRCMRLDEHTVDEGKMIVNRRQNARGGTERDPHVRYGPPGEVSGTLIMKRDQANRMKTILRTCLWLLDMRVHCGGMDRDSWNAWEEITRACPANFDSRAMSGSHWDNPEAEQMVTMPYTALTEVDIYRVTGEGVQHGTPPA